VQRHCRAYPAINELAAARRSRSSGQPSRYEGTNRYYRGRVLAALRALPDDQTTLDLESLGSRVRADFQPEQTPWLYEVVRGLTKDGLAELAEERPVYDAGSGSDALERASLVAVKVRLP
jgi:A/G-specific adenine glycosylase